MTDISMRARPGSAVTHRWIVAATVLLGAAIELCWQALAARGPAGEGCDMGQHELRHVRGQPALPGRRPGKSLGLNRWRLGSWTLLWYSVAFGLATLTWAQPQTGTLAQISLPSVLRALWLVAVAMTLWTLGYLTGPGRPARRFGHKMMTALSLRLTPEVRSPLAPWILYGASVAASIASAVTTGRFGYVGDAASAVTTASGYQQVLNLLGYCAPMAVAAAALQVYRERVPGARVTLTVLFLAEIARGAASGTSRASSSRSWPSPSPSPWPGAGCI